MSSYSPPSLEQQLLDEILAHPDDDTARLVYADRLTEREDPRGAFIADQCRLAVTDETDPAWSLLHAKTERAWLRHRDRWTAPLRALFDDPPAPDALRCRRGFVEGIELRSLSCAQLDALCALTPIRSLRIPYGRWQKTVDAVRHGLQHHHVTRIESHEDLSGLTRDDLAPLRSLDLTSDWRRPTWLTRVEQSALRSLTVSRIDNDLAKNILSSIAIEALDALSLTDSWFDVSLLDRLLKTPGGRPLRLSFARHSSLPLREHLGALFAWRPLRALDLGEALDKLTISQLVSTPGVEDIRWLGLRGDSQHEPISDGAERLSDIPFRALTRLDLSTRKLRDARSLLSSPSLRHLVSLDLEDTPIGDGGIDALIGSEIHHLTRLVLSRSGISDQAILSLAQWPGLAHVTTLEIDQPIGSLALSALAHSPWLDPVHLVIGWPKRDDPSWSLLRERFGEALSRY